MRAARLIVLATCLVGPASQALAQGSATPPPSRFAGLKEFGKKAIAVFQKPLHPIVKSVAPGGFFGGGLGYKRDSPTGGPWSLRSEAVVTHRRYWNTEATVTYQSDWLHSEFYGRARDMTRLDFYGIGNDTEKADRATFRYLDRSAGVLASVRLPTFDLVAFGGRIEGLWPRIGSGKNPGWPSIEDRFSESQAPGLEAQPGFLAYTGFVNFNYPGGNSLGRNGVDVQLAYSAYRDRADGRYDFNRLNLELQERFCGLTKNHFLTLHQYISTTGGDAVGGVPFYLQYTLGGAGSVRPFHEEMIGSDATKATLRGFENLRFRGPHLFLLQAEYRFKAWGPIDATVFVDAGNVATNRSDLNFTGLKSDIGFSVSAMMVDSTLIRFDFGKGREGTKVFFSIGPIFQR